MFHNKREIPAHRTYIRSNLKYSLRIDILDCVQTDMLTHQKAEAANPCSALRVLSGKCTWVSVSSIQSHLSLIILRKRLVIRKCAVKSSICSGKNNPRNGRPKKLKARPPPRIPIFLLQQRHGQPVLLTILVNMPTELFVPEAIIVIFCSMSSTTTKYISTRTSALGELSNRIDCVILVAVLVDYYWLCFCKSHSQLDTATAQAALKQIATAFLLVAVGD